MMNHNGLHGGYSRVDFMGTRDGDSQSRGVPEELRTYSWLLKTYKGDMRKMSGEERDLFVFVVSYLWHQKSGIRTKEYRGARGTERDQANQEAGLV